jgi:phage protein D
LWENMSLADVAKTIAQEHGLNVKVASALQGKVIGTLEQIDETDLAFLARLATNLGGAMRVRAGQLEVMPTGSLAATPVQLDARDIESWYAPLGERLKAGRVVARWHAPKSGRAGEEAGGTAEPTVVLWNVFESKDAAKSAAETSLKARERESAQLSLALAALRTDIGTGAPLSVSGLRKEIDGPWTAVEVVHRASSGTARTSVVAQRELFLG